MQLSYRFGLPCFVALILPLSGCSSRPQSTGAAPDPVRENLGLIYKAYQQAEKDLHRPPKNEEEFTPSLAKIGATTETLRSPGDDERFVIIFGALSGPMGMVGVKPKKTEFKPGETEYPPILAYEKVGASEGRHVLFVTGQITILDEARFRDGTFANNHKPQ